MCNFLPNTCLRKSPINNLPIEGNTYLEVFLLLIERSYRVPTIYFRSKLFCIVGVGERTWVRSLNVIGTVLKVTIGSATKKNKFLLYAYKVKRLRVIQKCNIEKIDDPFPAPAVTFALSSHFLCYSTVYGNWTYRCSLNCGP